MKTYSTKSSDIKRENHTLDASDQTLGHLAAHIAVLLMGKNKPVFTRNIDIGDYVTVINAGKINVSGKKLEQKMYYRHSGYPGGFKSTSLNALMENHPTRVIEYAVKGMLPTNRLRAQMMKRLRIYAGELPRQVDIKTVITSEKKEE
jgi:large subunit ribosomal protein L13